MAASRIDDEERIVSQNPPVDDRSATPIYTETLASPAYDDLQNRPLGDDRGGSGAAGGGARDTANQAKDAAGDVAAGAKDAGQRVAGTTKEQASRVASDAADQAKRLMGEATSQLSEQAGKQQQRAASTLGSVAEDLRSMRQQHQGDDGLATELIDQLGRRAHEVSQWLEQRRPEDVLDEVKQLAARRPGLFIALALGAGVVGARLTKALVADAKDDDGASTAGAGRGSSAGVGTGVGATTAGVGTTTAGAGDVIVPGVGGATAPGVVR